MTRPTFLGIGAAKCGTTSVENYLDQHPEVHMSSISAPKFFVGGDPRPEPMDPRAVTGPKVSTLAEYEALFDGADGARAVGEISPAYLHSPGAPARIADLLPDVQLILQLRDPVDRAWSGWMMQVRKGRAPDDPGSAFSATDRHVLVGFYADNVERYLATFGRDRIHLMVFDELGRDPIGTMRVLFDWLGVDPSFRPSTAIHNPGGLPRRPGLHRRLVSRRTRRVARYLPEALVAQGRRQLHRRSRQRKPVMPDDLRDRLRELYRNDLERTAALLDVDLLRWWGP